MSISSGSVCAYRIPDTPQKDAYFQTGWLLQQAANAPEPLARLLAMTRLVLGLMCDVMRPGGGRAGAQGDPQDTPVTLLCQHYLSHRELGGYSDGSSDQVCIQEICTFDRNEGPKTVRRIGREGAVPLASLHWWVDPTARAKYKRISGKQYAKVKLEGGGKACFLAPPGMAELEGGSIEENYEFSLPDLVLQDPLSGQCVLEWKGTLMVHCPDSGLVASLAFKDKTDVKGSLESVEPGGSPLKAKATKLGTFSGSLMGIVEVACPSMGLEGTVHDCTSAGGPMHETGAAGKAERGGAAGLPAVPPPPLPLPALNLQQLGPMRLPRLWSALHDALLYNNPALATGGKAAAALSFGLSSRLGAMFFNPLESRDLQAPAAADGKAGKSSGAGMPGAQVAGGSTGAGMGADDDSSDEEAAGKGQAEGAGMAAEGDAAVDTRDLPPCYKAEHAAGRKLRYQLHCTLVRMPNRFLAAPQST